MLTTHGAPVIPAIPPSSVSSTTGQPVVLIGPLHIAPHTFGNDFHASNPVAPGQGSKLVTADGLPLAFVGDSFV
jgi:hypothetical protein